jgi:PTS system nitrogen regulatory IIA component
MLDKLPEILTTAEVAKFLRINPETVKTKAKKGEWPAIKIGSAWRFHRSFVSSLCEKMCAR